jgi:hypothetical protein
MDNPADRSGLASRRLVVMIEIETPENRYQSPTVLPDVAMTSWLLRLPYALQCKMEQAKRFKWHPI